VPAPLITIITPTLNAAAFLEETMRSVDGQSSDLEHVVVDGGSTDETAAIVARFPRARLIELPDSSQTRAMEYGAAIARGEFLVFLNADDMLAPGALASLLAAIGDADVVYGRADHIDERGSVIEPYPTRAFDAIALTERCFICQAATMIRRSSFERAGGFTASLNYAMDYDLWLRMVPWARFVYVESLIGEARLHREAKTVARRTAIFHETFDVLRSRTGYVPYTWTYAYADHRLQGDDQVFDPRKRSRWKVLYALLLGVWNNPRRPFRAVRDWAAHRS
jgi:glycosyltransferase involved in cell wall biosynthesis